MAKKDVIAMLLAGGQGSRLGILTKSNAKPAVTFGGKYRIIDFTLSNCINSAIDTVGVLTQYQPLLLNQHIGIGIPWDLDRKYGGVTVLPPHLKGAAGNWYSGTANAVFQNLDFIERYSPEYVLVLSGDHIYKMDYSKMLDYHIKNNASATIAVLEVPIEEANRFGIMNTDGEDKIVEFQEKPANPISNLASMGIYIFNWNQLKQALIDCDKDHPDSDFGKHIVPYMLDKGWDMYAYRFQGYWKDVGTLESYMQANLELVQLVPEFNLYEDYWKIFTNYEHQPPQYIDGDASIQTSIISEGCEIYGEVYNSVLGPGVVIEKDSIIKDSIIMSNTIIQSGCKLQRCIIAEECIIGNNVEIGEGPNVPNCELPKVYDTGITVIGEKTLIPDNINIGKNCVISGRTQSSDYSYGKLESGQTLVKDEVNL